MEIAGVFIELSLELGSLLIAAVAAVAAWGHHRRCKACRVSKTKDG